jgi:segregation and condensation protein B
MTDLDITPDTVAAAAPAAAPGTAPDPAHEAALATAADTSSDTAFDAAPGAAFETVPETAAGTASEAVSEVEPAGPPTLDEPPLGALLEAVLMVAENPVPVADLVTGLGYPPEDVERCLAALAGDYEEAGRGFALRFVGGGWRFYAADACAPWVERFVLAGQHPRLSQAALETLAVVAYQQPVTRGRISAVRGVAADGVIRTLVARGLVEEAGTDPDSGASTYRTTPAFLERLGLRDLGELPPLAPLLPDLTDLPDE